MSKIVTAPESVSQKLNISQLFNIVEICERIKNDPKCTIEKNVIELQESFRGRNTIKYDFKDGYTFYSNIRITNAINIKSVVLDVSGIKLYEFINKSQKDTIDVAFGSMTHDNSMIYPSIHMYNIPNLTISTIEEHDKNVKVLCDAHFLHHTVRKDIVRLKWYYPHFLDSSECFGIMYGMFQKCKRTDINKYEPQTVDLDNTHGQLMQIDDKYCSLTIYHDMVGCILDQLVGKKPDYVDDGMVIQTMPACKVIPVAYSSKEINNQLLKKYGARYYYSRLYKEFTEQQLEIMREGNIKYKIRMQKVIDWLEKRSDKYPLESEEELIQARNNALVAKDYYTDN